MGILGKKTHVCLVYLDKKISDGVWDLFEKLIRPHEAGGAGTAVAPPIFFNIELCPISSTHKNLLEVLDNNSGCCKLLQAIFGFIVLQFVGQGNLIYSSYHRNRIVLVSPQYFGLSIDLNWRIRCLCIYFVPNFQNLAPQENIVSGGLLLMIVSFHFLEKNQKFLKFVMSRSKLPYLGIRGKKHCLFILSKIFSHRCWWLHKKLMIGFFYLLKQKSKIATFWVSRC